VYYYYYYYYYYMDTVKKHAKRLKIKQTYKDKTTGKRKKYTKKFLIKKINKKIGKKKKKKAILKKKKKAMPRKKGIPFHRSYNIQIKGVRC